MKKRLKWIIIAIGALVSCLPFLWFVRTCTYDSMTHLSGDEIAWVTNRHKGEVMYFKSTDGALDTAIIREVEVYNSLDPINWGYLETGSEDYTASAKVSYSLSGKRYGGFYISKRKGDSTIRFSPSLDMSLYGIPLEISSLEVDGKTLYDVMYFDNTKSDKYNPDDENDGNLIISYAWSKKYGLVQYTLQDGTVFNRIELNDQNLKKTKWFPLNS